ncbi:MULTISPECIES: hypothetical protein [unclassified Paenibacillus]|uniref:hypothetical protein n=1 Tax=unclassified Paenibacillus TaxID=185978 RepID=UPI0024738AD5|nr:MULTISPECIES: hypothetical protein [unclassified Paenibacillus]MDH6430454.1 hypothetical protein [Paenibacillus sp. PastH-4]MDH6447048.1 hypothetical protein [Paenibacillus sp. PastF-4]MDH6530846.1 hypothetical protein [Paenibacillus sp. PastH-3]
MFKKIYLIAFAVTIISGVALISNSKADTYPEMETVNKTVENPVNTNFSTNNVKSVESVESVKNVESVESKIAKGYYSQLYTPHGMFLRADKQSIFKESEIARNLDQIGPNTNQLIFEGEFFLKVDESTFLKSYPNSLILNETLNETDETDENPIRLTMLH